MRLRALTLGELETLHRTRMGQDFPPEELKPFAAMQTLYEAGAYHPMGAWEGEDMVGYALLWESPGTGYLLLDYLGVEASRRNAGLGGEILRLLQGAFRDRKGILVESEAPDGDGRDVLRQRRMGFYRRNGFAFRPRREGRRPSWRPTGKSPGPSWPPGPMRRSWRSPGTPSAPPPRQSPGRGRPTSPAWGRGRKDDGAC